MRWSEHSISLIECLEDWRGLLCHQPRPRSIYLGAALTGAQTVCRPQLALIQIQLTRASYQLLINLLLRLRWQLIHVIAVVKQLIVYVHVVRCLLHWLKINLRGLP